MALAQISTLAKGYSPTAPDEAQLTLATIGGTLGRKPPLLYFHGSGDLAPTLMAKAGQKALLEALAQRYAVIAGDFGGQAWGNPAHVDRALEAADYLSTTWGTRDRLTLVAGSMGTLGALRLARLYPHRIRAIAAVIPALDLASLQTFPAIAADLVSAYAPTGYNDATMGATYSPVKYAAQLDPDLPIHLWTASNDTITLPATADAFVAARPQTGRTDVGPLGHSEAAVVNATPALLDWLATT